MKTGFVLFAFLVAAFSNEPACAKETVRIKHQMEAGFNLSERAARNILADYDFKPEERIDYYVDIYDGRQFLLIPHANRYKFRLKTTARKWTVQANTKSGIYNRRCPTGETFQINDKKIGERILQRTNQTRFSEGVVEQLKLLTMDRPQDVVESIRQLHQFFLDLNVPLMPELTEVPQHGKWYFTASHVSKKIKWKMRVDMGHGEIEASVTHGYDFVGDTFVQDKYEIEFQIEDEMSVDQFAESICEFMSEQDLTSEDLLPDRVDPQSITLLRLNRFNADLGL